MWRGIIALLILVGCAPSAYVEQQKSAYLQKISVFRQAVAAKSVQPPLVMITFHPDGKIASLSVSHEVEYPEIENFVPAPHPGWRLGGTALRTAGVLGGIYLTGQALENMMDAAGSTTTTTSTNTSYSGNYESSFNDRTSGSQIGSQGFVMDRNNGEFQYGGGSEGQSWKPRRNNNELPESGVP